MSDQNKNIESKLQEFKKIIDASNDIVFFGGAGVSTESGVPDFRGEQGLWRAKTRFNCSPEEIVSLSFFHERPDDFYEYYMQNLIYPDVKPNVTHNALARLEEQGKLKAIITQNIDGLHQAAGSKTVHEVHGSISRSHCIDCGKQFPLDYTLDKSNWKSGTYTPVCDACGSILKPDVIFFEEMLDDKVLADSVIAMSHADTLIVGGSSLVVYPAAGLIRYFKGKNLILINMQETPYDDKATLVIHESLGKVFSCLD